jgi:hypothetical protein
MEYMITFQHPRHAKHKIKHVNDTYLLAGVNPPTTWRPSMNLPAIDHASHHAQ